MLIKSLFKYSLPLKRVWHNVSQTKIRSYHRDAKTDFKATIIGACGQLGQALAFELKKSAPVGTLALYDIKNSRSLALDLCYIDTGTKVNHFHGRKALMHALEGSSLVILTAGTPRFGPNITKTELFHANVQLVTQLTKACNSYCPDAFIVVATSPVNMLVPIVCELTDNAHKQTRVFGLTSINNMRTRAVLANHFKVDVSSFNKDKIPIYGGHSDDTIMPFLSQTSLPIQLNKAERKSLAAEIRTASTNVLRTYQGRGSAAKTVSLAGKSFLNSLLQSITENITVEESAYIYCDVIRGLSYGVTTFTVDKNGVKSTLKPPSNITEEENCEFQQAISNLKRQLNMTENYIRRNIETKSKKDATLKV